MKKKLPPFIAGITIATMVFGLSATALAASGQITFNMSPIQFNGQQISAKGADYTLDNGCQAPSSITYTDEKGGGTTYLPVRRIAELMGVDIGYDAATGAVTVSGEQQAEKPETAHTADTTTIPDYSSWSAEEEAAYQEFKGMWDNNGSDTAFTCSEPKVISLAQFINNTTDEQIFKYSTRLSTEMAEGRSEPFLIIGYKLQYFDEPLWVDVYTDNGTNYKGNLTKVVCGFNRESVTIAFDVR